MVKNSLDTQHKFLTYNNHLLHSPNQIWVKNIYYKIYDSDSIKQTSACKQTFDQLPQLFYTKQMSSLFQLK